MFRGWQHSDPRVLEGAAYLERQGVSKHDIYRNYYLTLLLYHVGGRTFDQWNPRMRDSLINSQERSGHAKGSWYFEDKWERSWRTPLHDGHGSHDPGGLLPFLTTLSERR